MNRQDSMQFKKMINTIDFAQKANTSFIFILQKLQHIQFRFCSTTVHQNSVLHFWLDVNIVDF